MITLDVAGVKELEKALGDDAKSLPRHLSAAINASATKVRSNVSKQVREELAAPAKDIAKVLKVKSRAKASSLGATVQLDEEKRLSLKSFGARQTRAGVTYKTSPKEGRKRVDGAFMGPRPGVIAQKLNGHAYKRRGQSRKPIVKLMGASPWGAYVVHKMERKTVKDGQAELEKQVKRRIQFVELKRAGVIK